MHRFKVNSLQKLLIHINFLLAFSVLFCSHSAFGQSGASAVVGPTVTLVKRDYSGIPNSSYIVDLGLSDVYWADRNVGANDPTDEGDYFAWGEINTKKSFRVEIYDYWKHSVYTSRQYYFKKYWVNTSYPSKNNANYIDNIKELQPRDDAATQQWGTYWRMPTADNVRNLLTITNKNSTNNGVTIQNNNYSIFIPSSGYRGAGVGYNPTYTYFWSSTLYSGTDMEHNSYTAYAFVSKGNNATPYIKSDELRFAGIPVRPVIDKFLVTYIKNIDGVTTSTDTIHVPNGTKITLSASDYGCYDLAWTKVDKQSSESNNGSAKKEFTITSNTTITASFTSKKYSVSAYIKYGDSDAKYSSKFGNLECGQYRTISVPIDNCYVFQGWEGPGITGRLAAGQEADGYSCQVDNSVSPTQAKLTIPNIDSNTQLNRDYTAIFSIKTTNIRATTDSSKGWVGLNVWK